MTHAVVERTYTPWNEAMRRFLSDGQWHPLEAVVRAGLAHVPPQIAAQTYRRELARRRKGVGTNKAKDRGEEIRDGRWHTCRRLVLQWQRRGLVTVDPPEWRAANKRVKWNRD